MAKTIGRQVIARTAPHRFEAGGTIHRNRFIAVTNFQMQAVDPAGFRCPLYPGERVGDVATALVDLLRDCRVADIRVLAGVHPDREPVTGGMLLFKPETVPPGAAVTLH